VHAHLGTLRVHLHETLNPAEGEAA